MTIRCQVCGRSRKIEDIAVYTRDISSRVGLPAGTAKENIQYCIDNPLCAEAAPEMRFFK